MAVYHPIFTSFSTRSTVARLFRRYTACRDSIAIRFRRRPGRSWNFCLWKSPKTLLREHMTPTRANAWAASTRPPTCTVRPVRVPKKMRVPPVTDDRLLVGARPESAPLPPTPAPMPLRPPRLLRVWKSLEDQVAHWAGESLEYMSLRGLDGDEDAAAAAVAVEEGDGVATLVGAGAAAGAAAPPVDACLGGGHCPVCRGGRARRAGVVDREREKDVKKGEVEGPNMRVRVVVFVIVVDVEVDVDSAVRANCGRCICDVLEAVVNWERRQEEKLTVRVTSNVNVVNQLLTIPNKTNSIDRTSFHQLSRAFPRMDDGELPKFLRPYNYPKPARRFSLVPKAVALLGRLYGRLQAVAGVGACQPSRYCASVFASDGLAC